MLVRCPKCTKKLKVQDEKVGGGGMKFRCPACGGIFLVRGPAPAQPLPPPDPEMTRPEPPEEAPAPEERGSVLSGFGQTPSDEDAPEEGEGHSLRLENPLSGWGNDPVPRPAGHFESQSPTGDFGLDPPLEPHQESESAVGSPPLGIASVNPPEESSGRPEAGRDEDTSGQEIERARRLARTIMSDIALYHIRMVEDSIRNDTFFDVMGDEIREGMKLYNSRIAPEIRATSDFYREAVENFYQRRRAELAGL